MIAHLGFYVDDLQKSDAFYCSLLKVIGYDVIYSLPQFVAYGTRFF
ncbi:hypothetical protein [Candidatus Berkiella aquae]|uniref:VOC domain-containing protein n=1 Tax=Candidatus Berkiella aquae TaxID=295108 RepID=A0A0Q9YPE2_9GAMM|nr:hypothetical protein [Candidatus Berkiella aquae]MCS5711999.1 hypothetical protein [Candidatus Berkiella aquae]